MKLNLNYDYFMHKLSIISILIGFMLPSLASEASNPGNTSNSEDSIRGTELIDITLSSRINAGWGDHTPFWLMNGQYGKISDRQNNFLIEAGAFRKLNPEEKFSWGAGLDLTLTAGYGNGKPQYSIFPQQVYGEVKYRSLSLMAGTKEIPGWISDPELSSGNLLYANNSRPIPQVRAGIFDYTPVWGTNHWLAVKGYLAYGAFSDNHWIEDWARPESKYTLNTLYCSRGGMIRVGNTSRFPLSFEGGIEMATEFGGQTHNKGEITVSMPHTFKNWIKALIPMGGGNDTPLGEQANVEGNMLGNWNFALSWTPENDWSARLYYQHLFEDHSMLFFDYPWRDGLWGAQLNLPRNPILDSVVFEFLYTKDQAGAVYWDHNEKIREQVSGRDAYFQHSIYNGWQNYGMTIGTPLLRDPIYNSDHLLTCESNRVRSYHLGLGGTPAAGWRYRILATYQMSWGTYSAPFPERKRAASVLTEVSWSPQNLKDWKFGMAFAADRGSLLGHNTAFMFNLSKTLGL